MDYDTRTYHYDTVFLQVVCSYEIFNKNEAKL